MTWDPANQFQWLGETLEQAREDEEKVIIYSMPR